MMFWDRNKKESWWEGLLAPLFLILIFGALFDMPKKKKRWLTWKKTIIIVLSLVLLWKVGSSLNDQINPYTGDCVPLTLQRVFPGHSVKELRGLCETQKQGTEFFGIQRGWCKLSTNDIVWIYSDESQVALTTNAPIELGKPYIWIGYVGVDGKPAGHCALVMFTETNAVLSNSQYWPKTTNWYCVDIPYTNFFNMTIAVGDAPELTKDIRMR